MRDIDIKCDDGNFKLRTSAIIIKNNKILLQKSKCRDGYCFPGGHVEFGEITSEAILREVKEEINIDTKIIDLYCISELIYKSKEGKINQEINYYYKLECLSEMELDDFELVEIDKGVEKKHHYSWIDINKINNIDLKPQKIAEMLQEDINIKDKIILIDER